MPVPLNAFLDVAKVWFTEKLDYLANDSIPVKPAYEKKSATPSDIDLICKHPKEQNLVINFESGRTVTLSPNLLVECKGWFDFPKPAFFNLLNFNLTLLRKQGKSYLPKSLPSPKREPHLFFLREEIHEEGQRRFGTKDFQRVLIGPFLIPPRNVKFTTKQLIDEYERHKIIILEIQDIAADMFKFIQQAKEDRKAGKTQDYNKLRKTYALEMLHLVNTYFELKKKS
ncbi:MAG TPA: hypothetical protein PKV48_03505 [Thermodesulfobacteriota bacterium]|nr:hypothetical protein [Thermodesulfobacteriota bacterium]